MKNCRGTRYWGTTWLLGLVFSALCCVYATVSLAIEKAQPFSSLAEECRYSSYPVLLSKQRGLFSCQASINSYYLACPPISDVGDLEKPDPELVAQKITRAQGLWLWVIQDGTAMSRSTISFTPDPDCIQKTREACWEYCSAGIDPGALDLYCIFNACAYY